MACLLSSAGMPIWQESDPVHLTNAAYGDIAASLVKVVSTAATDPSVDMLRRPRLESVVTKPREATAANMTPGWILREAQQGGRGRGATGRGFGSRVGHSVLLRLVRYVTYDKNGFPTEPEWDGWETGTF